MNPKKTILLLGDINSIHLHKWIVGLRTQFKVLVFSLDQLHPNNAWIREQEDVTVFDAQANVTEHGSKLRYLKQLRRLKKIYTDFKPDITHAHYATSYGLLGGLCNPKNYCISLWGTDTYLFPKQSVVHQFTFKFILRKADYLFATSHNLAQEGKKYTTKKIEVIPFGIDTQLFSPAPNRNDLFTVGTVKGLDLIYGIDRLVDAFATFNKKYPESQCLIYGKGRHEQQFLEQIKALGMEEKIHLKGFVSNREVPAVLNTFDVYCALSRSESFGVAVIEASACGLPVIVSDIGGLTEVVRNRKTGLIVDGNSGQEIVQKLEELYQDQALAKQLGKKGREFVAEKYEWKNNLQQQIDFYLFRIVS